MSWRMSLGSHGPGRPTPVKNLQDAINVVAAGAGSTWAAGSFDAQKKPDGGLYLPGPPAAPGCWPDCQERHA